MKKFFAILLAALMVATMSVTAFAAEINPDSDPKTGDTSVTYSVAPTYTVTIPATVTLGETAEIKAENVRVNKGYEVNVKLTSTSAAEGAFVVKSAEGAELLYTVKNGEADVTVGNTVLTVNPETATTGSTTLSFVAPADVQYAGTYTGTVTFTVSVDEAIN